jgi:hypothetical protein
MNPTTKGETKEKSKEGIHYYNEGGYRVFTAEYHRVRGYCCGSGCRHCPFEPRYEKNSKNLKKD